MRPLVIAIMLVCGCASYVAGQEPVSGKTNRTAAELIKLESDIGQANIRRDKAFFERVEAAEFVFTDSAGGVTTKAEDVASLDKPEGEFKLVDYVVDDMKVLLYGKTAVVTGRVTTRSKNGSREATSRSRFTDVFVKRDGRWQIVAGHSSRIREPQK